MAGGQSAKVLKCTLPLTVFTVNLHEETERFFFRGGEPRASLQTIDREVLLISQEMIKPERVKGIPPRTELEQALLQYRSGSLQQNITSMVIELQKVGVSDVPGDFGDHQ